jgi:hypothetical protein
MQEVLRHAQDGMVQSTVQAYSLLAFNPQGPSSLREDQLRDLEHQILDCLGGVIFWDQVADQLSREYARDLKAK